MESASATLCFNCSKSEAFSPQAGLKAWRRKLQGTAKIFINKDPISLERLQEASCYAFACPQECFTAEEFDAMRQYVREGGSLLFMLGEGGERKLGTNVNYFLEEYGVVVNNDAVVRTVYHKYLHPKEVFVSNGVVNSGVNAAAGKRPKGAALGASLGDAGANADLCFVYPYGASLTVQKPAFPVLSSGPISFPLNRPVCALATEGPGRVCVLGSSRIFEDGWLDKEENAKLADVIVKWLLRQDQVELDPLDSDEVEGAELDHAPDTESLAQRVRSCLEESEEVSRDFTTLFDDTVFKFDTSLIPESVKLYKVWRGSGRRGAAWLGSVTRCPPRPCQELDVKHEPLSLIPPEFETPLPPLQPAVRAARACRRPYPRVLSSHGAHASAPRSSRHYVASLLLPPWTSSTWTTTLHRSACAWRTWQTSARMTTSSTTFGRRATCSA